MNYLILVNKEHGLDSNYIPDNLVLVKHYNNSNQIIYLEKKTYKQIKSLIKDMQHLFSIPIYISAGYRPYFYQENLYNDKIKEKGEIALIEVSPPGHSEHQTGLALNLSFEGKEEEKWLINNAHKYGFIIRYPLGKESITGYKYMPKHLRYIGDKAQILYKYNLTLEEYYEMFI